MSALLDSALRYARHGLHVFPCRGKAPLTPNGLHAATCHTAQIRAWFGGRRPDPNVAIRTGAVSDLVALDIDGDDGWESLRRLEARYDVVPRTASVKTPRGGSHYWFRHPGGTVANSASTLGPCLDIRGDGGYVVAPPSIGACGRRYEPDEEAPIAPLPDWLRDLVVAREDRTRPPAPADTWIGMVRHGLSVGERNQGLTRLVGHLLARDVDARLVLEIAQLVNQRATPPLPEREAEHIVASIARRELLKRTGARR